jgi:hypothetical protein
MRKKYNQRDKEFWRGLVAVDNAYGVHPQSKQWFGIEIAKRLGLRLDLAADKKTIRLILRELIENGWFKVVLRVGDWRRAHQYLDLGDNAGL